MCDHQDARRDLFTDSLWAVASSRDREHRDTLDSGEHSDQERGVDRGKAQPSTRRENSIYRQEVQRWIGHEAATNHCETVPNHHEDCRERIRSSREVNHVTEQVKTPQIQCAEKRDSPGAVHRQDRPQEAKIVEVATGAVHQQDHPEGTKDH